MDPLPVPDRARPYPDIYEAIIVLVVLFVLQVGFSAATAGLVLIATGMPSPPGDPAVTGATLIGAYALTVLWVLRRSPKPFAALFPFSRFRLILFLPLLVAVVGLGIVSSEVDNLTRFVLPMPPFVARLFVRLVSGGALSLFVLAVVAPVTEEMVFRGFLLGGLLRCYSPRKAILISAALFMVFHLNPYQFFSTFAVGLLLGWVFWKTRSVWPCVLLHAANNAAVWLARHALGLHIPGYTTGGQGGLGGPVEFQPLWFSVLGVVLLVAGIGLAVWLTRLKPEPLLLLDETMSADEPPPGA